MSGQLRSAVLAFVAGVALVAVVGGTALYVLGKGGGSEQVATKTPEPTNGPYPVLADGQYIDSLPSLRTLPSGFTAVPLTYLASKTGVIVVVEVTGVDETVVPSPGPGTTTPVLRRFQPLPWTTYSAHVEQWIKGGKGESDIKFTEVGGVDYDGPRLLTGTFFLQVGRKYLLSLDAATPGIPGSGDYAGAAAGWASFEVTDGKVHVLNELESWKLMGAYNLTPLNDFIPLVQQWMTATPAVTPTSPPFGSPTPTSSP